MTKLLEVFDPPMCCSSGVCGPKIDKKFAQFSAALEWLRSKGVRVERYNPTQQYDAFIGNTEIVKAVNERGMNCLPVIVVNGNIVSYGGYPDKAELAAFAGVASDDAITKQKV